MFVPISFSDNFVVLRKISVSPAFWEKWILSSPSCVCYRSKVLTKIFRKKLFSWRKQNFFYLLLILLHLFFWEQKLFYFSTVLLIFCVCAFLFFLFLFFSGVFHIFWICPNKNLLKKNIFREIVFFFKKKNKFNFFLEEGTYFDPKHVQKLTFEFSSQKISLKKEKNLFQDSHALRIACAIAACRDGWASQVYVHSVVIDLGRGTSVASSRLSP